MIWHNFLLSLKEDTSIPKGKGYIPFGLNKLSSSLPLSHIIARFVQVTTICKFSAFFKVNVNVELFVV
jgi:hypothetical protein